MKNTVVIMLIGGQSRPSPQLIAEMLDNQDIRVIIADSIKGAFRSLKIIFETNYIPRLMIADPTITTFAQLQKKLLAIKRVLS